MPGALPSGDPLPSWNDGANKQRIVDFVKAVSTEGSKDYVAPEERVAVFDNDGTLWAEYPMYFQVLFALDRVRALAPQHPEWKDKEPFASLIAGDMKAALASGEHGHPRDAAGDPGGMRPRSSTQLVRQTGPPRRRHPRLQAPLHRDDLPADAGSRCAYLRANGFKTFIVSGGGVEFMRALAGEGLRHPARAGGRQRIRR